MNWLQILGPPLLMIIGGIISWVIKNRVEELKAAEENIRETRTKTYWDILEPYITLFSEPTNLKKREEVMKTMTSLQYKKTAFQLYLLGSDDVIKAYNTMLQDVYEADRKGIGEQAGKDLMRNWGALLIEIRKSLGNKKTELKAKDMLRGMIKNIDEFLK